jgi:hypothetical protein
MQSGGTLDYQIGNFREGAIHGFKFEDLDANGKYDGLHEKPIAGIPMQLSRDADGDGTYETVENSANTDEFGQFAFAALGPGRYRVSEIVPAVAVATTPPFDLQLLSGEVAMAFADQAVAQPGQVPVVFSDLAFGNFYFGAICGYKFNDLDGQGIDNGDPRLTGVQIQLEIDANEDGVFETTRSASTESPFGYYCFRDLGPGKYRVSEAVPNGAVQTTPEPAVIDLLSGEVWVAQGGMALVTQHQVQVLELDLAFGNFELVDLSGTKYLDIDGDGTRDPGDVGLGNWTIQLDLNNDGSMDRTATTDLVGKYTFADVGPGTHVLTEVQQDGYQQTFPAGNGRHLVTTESGEDVGNLNFGNQTQTDLSIISGTIFRDADQNGARGETEPGLADWIVYLDANNDGVLNHESFTNTCDDRSREPCWITEETGGFAFVVPIGAYVVRQILQQDWTQTVPQSPDLYFVEVTADDQRFLGRDFGNFVRTGAIHGYVYHDLNGDFVDNQEPRFANWPVTLQLEIAPNSYRHVETIQTDGGGLFAFRNLTPGVYDVTANDQGTELRFALTYRVDPGNVYMAYPGQATTEFGEFPIVDSDLARGVFFMGEIRGYAFDDQNANGKDDQEPRLENVTVRFELDLDGDQIAEVGFNTTTDSRGVYRFDDLLSYQSFRVVLVPESGQRQTTVAPPWMTVDSGQVWIAHSDLATPLQNYQQTTDEVRLALGLFNTTWTNPVHPSDVSGDGFIAPLDALAIINTLNEDGSRFLLAQPGPPYSAPFYDVNGDGFVAPLDALTVINYINTNGAGPVPTAPSPPSPSAEGEADTIRSQPVVIPWPDEDKDSSTPLSPRKRWPRELAARIFEDLDDLEATLDTIAPHIVESQSR